MKILRSIYRKVVPPRPQPGPPPAVAPSQGPVVPPRPVPLDRQVVANAYLIGEGIEVGALSNPLPVPSGARVQYVDRMSVADLRRQYPELESYDLVPVDIIDDGERLATIPDGSQDFVIANHFIEHCQNPLMTLSNLFRVLKEGGVLYLGVPDKRFTFDRDREVTTLEHILRDYHEGPEGSKETHFREWVRLVNRVEGEGAVEAQVAELMEMDYSIHFHVWSQSEIIPLILSLPEHLGINFDIEVFLKNDIECIFVLRKLDPDLLESEMFGHEKGAFTGAVQRKIGKFEQANTGTIFLDEIGELDMNLQAKLLRAIQQRQFERVGGNELLTADVRIISATNKDLIKASREREFREDLYYRLASFPIVIPPLRERRPDILLLAEHFLSRFNARESKRIRSFSRRAIKMLYDYPWPGNVRELESAIERATILCDSDTIVEYDLPLAVQAFADGAEVSLPTASVFDNRNTIIPMESLKEQAVRHALKVTEGNVGDAARKLKISRSTMYELMKRFDVQMQAAA